MIFGDISNTEDMEKIYPEAIMKAINYLKNTDFNNLEVGNYEIQGKDIFCILAETQTKEKSLIRPEIHKKFLDIQFLIKGEECIGFARDTNNNKVVEDALEERDVLFYEDMENEICLTMKPGNFAILFPRDVHRPTCICNKISFLRKVIVKINIEIL